MTNLLITGGGGFLGKNFEHGYKLTREMCDLTDPKETLDCFDLIKPRYVIHAAAKVGGIHGNAVSKADAFYQTMMINLNVRHAAHMTGVKKIVSISSTCAFPKDAPQPYLEKDLHNGVPHNEFYGFAFAKRMLQVQDYVYSEQYGRNDVTILPSNIYGPYDNFKGEGGHVIPALIRKCLISKYKGDPFIVWGDGSPKREITYVSDVVDLSYWALDYYADSHEVLTIGSNLEYSIKEIAEMIKDILGYSGPIIFDKEKPNGPMRKITSIEKLRRYLPDYKFVSAEEGLSKTLEWAEKNYKEIIDEKI